MKSHSKPLKTYCKLVLNVGTIRYFPSQNRSGLLMRERLHSTSVVIVSINGGEDDNVKRVLLVYLKWSPHIWFSSLNPQGNSFRIYRHACFDLFKKFLATTNSSSVSTSFPSCIILRTSLSYGYHTKMDFACLLKFFGITVYNCVSNHK